jgi:hypothetical protein
MSTLGDAVRHGWAQADPARPEDTVRYFDDLLRRHPGQAGALLGYAGALDYADREAEAAGFYQQAIAAGLDPDEHRQALIQYGSTLRNLGRHQEAVAALVTLAVDRIDSDSLRHYQRALRHYAATLAQ